MFRYSSNTNNEKDYGDCDNYDNSDDNFSENDNEWNENEKWKKKYY